MKRLILAVGLTGLVASVAYADNVSDLMGLGMPGALAEKVDAIAGQEQLDNDTPIEAENAAGSSNVPLLKLDASDDTVLNADTGDVIKFSVALTPVAQMGVSGLTTNLPFAAANVGPKLVPQVPTPAATPADPANIADGRVVVIPTAAANAAVLAEATPETGTPRIICNNSANAARYKAGGAATLNGSSAGGYIALATKQCMLCVNHNGTDSMCGLMVVPTPAGP